MTSQEFLGCITALYIWGCIVPLVYRIPDPKLDNSTSHGESAPLHWPIKASLAMALAGSILAFAVTGSVAFGFVDPLAPSSIVELPWFKHSPIPTIALVVQVDRLGAFFATIISGFSALVAIYSFGALKADYFAGHRHRISSAFNVFVWSTLLVVLAADCISLIVALEVMSLSFGYLAVFKHLLFEGKSNATQKPDNNEDSKSEINTYKKYEEHKQHDARLAPQLYLMASHASTTFLVLAITILVLNAGSTAFHDIAAAVTAKPLNSLPSAAVFLLSLAGLGIRVGLVPTHVWVPLVHPSSPTPTHALSLGIAIKVGIYAMIRIFLQFTAPHVWWGYALLLIAAITALVNVWYAIASHDLKTALAYHSIENIGIITAGLGVALIFAGSGTPEGQWLAGLALVASLYHLLNHAVFKGLLYMATGSVDYLKNGLGVEYERLGGLIRLYPATSAAFILGAFAISGFPPLNGFISEWLTLQTLLLGLHQEPNLSKAVLIAALILLAVSFALTAFCFYKIVGIAFLGEPRLEEDRRKLRETPKSGPIWQNDSPWSMLGVMSVMTVICFLLGIMPGLVVHWLLGIVQDLRVFTIQAPSYSACCNLSLGATTAANAIELQLPIASIVSVAAILALAAFLFVRRTPVKAAETVWNCGTVFQPATMQYTGAALSELVRRFEPETEPPLPEKQKDWPTAGSKPVYAVRDEAERSNRIILDDWFRMSRSKLHPQWVHENFRAFFNRLDRWIYESSARFGLTVQNGDIRLYLRYILITQLAILILFLILRSAQ
ncbi:MAG: proton-conducting transporter membrane subunit [Rhodomicrobium sp.]|jgi:hydrogenase-4 component B